MKLPSFQFYPGDHRQDPAQLRCSKAAKGVWLEMMCVLHSCEERGVFATAGQPWNDQEIAVAVGGDISENLTCLQELIEKGVLRRNSSGCLYSRRIVRDEEKRRSNAHRQKRHYDKTEKPNANLTPTSHASSPSVSSSKKKIPLPPNRGEELFEAFYKAYPRKVNRPGALKAWKKIDSVEEVFDRIVRAVAVQARSERWTKDEGEYIPHPATWLNQRRWEDELRSDTVVREVVG